MLLGAVNLPGTFWKGSTAGHMQSQRFLEDVRDNFLIQSLVGPAQGVTLMDLLSLPRRHRQGRQRPMAALAVVSVKVWS